VDESTKNETMKTWCWVVVMVLELICFSKAFSQNDFYDHYRSGQPGRTGKEEGRKPGAASGKSYDTHYEQLMGSIQLTHTVFGTGEIVFSPLTEAVSAAFLDTAEWISGVRNTRYYCWIYGEDDSFRKKRRAFVWSVEDSGIVFMVSTSGNSFLNKNRKLMLMNISKIEKLKIRRKASVGKGMLIGAGIGFFIGGCLGLAGIPDYGILESMPPEQNALAGGLLFSIPGMIAGGIAGSFCIKFPINRSQPQYEKYKQVIAGYSCTMP